MISETMQRPPVTHHLKIFPEFFKEVVAGRKTFEIRRQRPERFLPGDCVLLFETIPGEDPHRVHRAKITYVTDFEQKPGFVVFGIK